MKTISQHRKPDHEIEAFFFERWSPRALTGEALPDKTLMRLFEAARWAPSCFNEQPWRFLYAKRDGASWNLYLNLLVEANQVWAKNASVLICCVSKKTFTRNGKPNRVHTFDAGAAWQNFALQAHRLGWAAHGMAGMDCGRAARDLEIPEDYQVEMMIAVGKPASPESLPGNLREREWPPSGRSPVSSFVREGLWDALS